MCYRILQTFFIERYLKLGQYEKKNAIGMLILKTME